MIRALTLLAPLVVAAGPALAVTATSYTDLGSFDGNDCVSSGSNNNWDGEDAFDGVDGDIANGECSLNGSPAILRIDFNDDGSIATTTTNTNFASIDGSEFTFDFGMDGDTNDGTWTYAPDDPTDPGVTGFVAKGGNFYRVFLKDGPAFVGIGDSADYETPNNGAFGLSHLTFFDSTTPVPLPAAGWLLLAGLGGLGAMSRRRG